MAPADRPFQPGGSPTGPSHLPRGSACLNCKRRKVRCDSEKPTCGPCRASRNFDDCEYPVSGTSHTQALQDNIARLENRIRDLQSSKQASSTMTLQHPYSAGPSSARNSRSPSTAPPSPFSIPFFEEPPTDFLKYILTSFFGHSPQLGFFLDVNRYRDLFLLPKGHQSRPVSSLLYSVYLWGVHLSPGNIPPVFNEYACLTTALREISTDLSGSHPHKVVQVLQAEILLSHYFLRNGKTVEGVYHANAAASLAISTNLHLIRSSRAASLARPLTPTTMMYPPVDPIEEGERIDAFWTCVILSNYWAVVEPAQSYTFYDAENFVIDTPWPLNDYRTETIVQGNSNTLARFVNGTGIDGFSALALHAKASVLLKKATEVRTQHGREPGFPVSHLDRLIEAFISSIPALDRHGIHPSMRPRIFIMQMLGQSAMVNLHSTTIPNPDVFRGKALAAAKSIATVTTIFYSHPSSQNMDCISGILWFFGCEALLRHLSTYTGHESSIFRRDKKAIREDVQAVMSRMTIDAQCCTLVGTFLSRVQQLFTAASH
ncbi:hypothetical protein BDQ12DRAFT_729417 [Crucibulum laeve]|uniref:Zn(2)-C6 fungal-type domain-containing protein n=1 Tax=Crucibulum laeve TaxID=68775 RepID=A0A5C3LFQ1_9AGAR|nr:hypothetical protein BDQ12DRAFT_729417 [Crucibulum laeve]